MSVDFFCKACCLTVLNDSLFGICDTPPPPAKPAYVNNIDDGTWIARVKNENSYEVTFVAIDNCLVINRANGEKDSTCDGMMLYNNSIIFVELKECNTDGIKWIRKGDSQLRSTINHFRDNHDITAYETKYAYLANSQRPNFRSSQKERMDRFKEETGVRLKIMAEIELT